MIPCFFLFFIQKFRPKMVLFYVATSFFFLSFFFFNLTCRLAFESATFSHTAWRCSALSSPLSVFRRDAEELLLAVRGGRRLCHHEGQDDKPVKRLRLCQIQRPQLRPDSAGDKAAQSGWEKCKCVAIKGAVGLINRGNLQPFLLRAVSKPSFFFFLLQQDLEAFHATVQFISPPSSSTLIFLPDWYLSTWQVLPVWGQTRRRGCFTWIFNEGASKKCASLRVISASCSDKWVNVIQCCVTRQGGANQP